MGGLILDEDIPALKEAGIAEVFTEGVTLDEMVKYFEQVAAAGRIR
jgi:methylmalonyl-CoA mutase cobalamin-binding subunit